MNTKRTLLLIAAFITLTLGSFIWYVATWDADKRAQMMRAPSPALALFEILPPEAPALTTGTLL